MRYSSIPSIFRDQAFLLPFLCLLLLVCSSWQSSDDELGDGAAIAMLMIVPAWILGFFLVRRAVIKYAQKMMMEVSKEEDRDQDIETQQEELPAMYQPTLVNLESKQALAKEMEDAAQLREEMVKQAQWLWKKKLGYVFIVFIGYITLPLLLVNLFETQQNVEEDSYFGVVGLVTLYFLLIVLQYFAFRKQFRALDNQSKFSLNYPVVGFLRRLTHPRVERVVLNLLIIFVFITSMLDIFDMRTNPDIPTSKFNGIALLTMALIHRQLYIYLRKQAAKLPTIKLLILRVFGRQENNQFTFDQLLHYWKHFGPTFTVIDPSYLYHHYRFLSTRGLKSILAVLVLIFILWASMLATFETINPQVGNLSRLELEVFTTSVMVLFAWWLYWQYWKRQMRKRFAKNLEGIEAQFMALEKKPRNWDLSHKNLHLNCYDNTWKLAVNSFVHRSDTILMDLRGFSKEREGCKYEVNFIIDTFPIEGIVFLVDSAADKDLIHQLILEQWKDQWVESPNLKSEQTEVKIFVSEKEDEVDLQYLIDLLIQSAHSTKGIKKPVIEAWS